MGDLLFPFPEPDFLFVHEVYLFGPDQMVTTTDGRGKVVSKVPDYVGVESARGYLTAPNADKDTTGYIERQSIDAVLLLPKNTVIDHDWLIACHDAQLPPHLAGVYDIETIRPNISHLRVLVRRYRRQWQEHT